MSLYLKFNSTNLVKSHVISQPDNHSGHTSNCLTSLKDLFSDYVIVVRS